MHTVCLLKGYQVFSNKVCHLWSGEKFQKMLILSFEVIVQPLLHTLFIALIFHFQPTLISTSSCTALFRCQTNCLVYLAVFLLIKQHIFWLVAKLKKTERKLPETSIFVTIMLY